MSPKRAKVDRADRITIQPKLSDPAPARNPAQIMCLPKREIARLLFAAGLCCKAAGEPQAMP